MKKKKIFPYLFVVAVISVQLGGPPQVFAQTGNAKLYIRERAIQRVDHIKLWVDDRLGSELSLSPEIYGIIIDEAHKHDIPVYAHIWHMRDAKGVVRARTDMLAHPA